MGRKVAFILFALLFAAGCTRESDIQKIKEVMKERVSALEKGDLELYARLISPDFRGKNGENRRDVLNKVSRIFSLSSSRKIEVIDQAVYLHGKRAEVVQKIRIILKNRDGREKILNGKEKILLTKEGDNWKITGGL